MLRAQTLPLRRTVLLILLTVATNGTFVLEQPSGSLVEYFPRFRWLLQQLVAAGGNAAAALLHLRANSLWFLVGAWGVYRSSSLRP